MRLLFLDVVVVIGNMLFDFSRPHFCLEVNCDVSKTSDCMSVVKYDLISSSIARVDPCRSLDLDLTRMHGIY
jgi:hypothetical protein